MNKLNFHPDTKVASFVTTNYLQELDGLALEIKELEDIYDHNVKQVQMTCIHDFSYVPDPSGNNDSGYCCSICRRWQRKL